MYGGIFSYPKKIRGKGITLMNKNLDMYKAL